MNELGKIPPQALDIEDAILGIFLIESESLEYVDKLTKEMFYTNVNQILFSAISELRINKSPVDLLTVTEYLKNSNELELIGGVVYLTKITMNVVLSGHLERHIAILKQKYIQREIIRVAYKIDGLAYTGDNLEECQSELTELNRFIDSNIVGDIKGTDLLRLSKENLDSAAQRMVNFNEGIINGINTGFGVMQQITGGWQKQDLIYIASRPSMGKTAISIHFAKMAAKRGFKVLFFSLEMSDISITDRLILGETSIDPETWRNGRITENDLQEYEDISRSIKAWKLKVYDKPGIKPSEISSICRKEKPDIIIIDYIQLMRADSNKHQNRNLELGSISRDLKGLAKEFDLPVMALAQLNRGIDARGSKVPVLSDLRDSGELEQDADIVIFPYRPYVYSNNQEDKFKIDLIMAKHRNGRLGITNASHNQYINNFADENFEQREVEF